ncbi:alpha/beta hydrolase family protein [Actinomadura oligospora]|uniref:alpha/beta hydrolase family protein n=1 Tax=Actinomadura oligospora TaxID=111804 RepID=UPI0004B68484|nr:alpha/beta fold hydrolase [Actinomadura oligospora]
MRTDAWTPPPYATPDALDERDVAVGSVGGALALPRAEVRVGAVLLSGGGPFDRDGTAGPNKPLKDLAWGLAGQGIASVRFDKPSGQAATMTDEYVPFAVEAVRRLRDVAERVFVVGHSMGGKVAPRVAEAVAVDGLALLAADAEPMHRAAVRVSRHLASLDPAYAEFATLIERQVAALDGLTPDTPSADLPFGLPSSYWADLLGYDPVAAAGALGLPMFVAQGGRDYQVTVADDLSRWRAAFEGRPDVTFRVYEADDHMFFPGSGPSGPADYLRPQHVDPDVVGDVAAWLLTV